MLGGVSGGMQSFGAGPSSGPLVPHKPSRSAVLDLTATLEHFNGISLLPVILETQRLRVIQMFQSYQEKKVCPPGQDTGCIPMLGQRFGLQWGHAPAACTTAFGQISAAA